MISLYNKLNQGFTYIESIIAISLTLAATTAIAFGIAKGVRAYRTIELKERAVEELIKYTDQYRMLVAYGETPQSGIRPLGGEEVTLLDPEEENAGFTWGGNSANLVIGKLYHKLTNKSTETVGNQSGYWNIKTWIEWDDTFLGDHTVKNLAFEVNQAIIKKD